MGHPLAQNGAALAPFRANGAHPRCIVPLLEKKTSIHCKIDPLYVSLWQLAGYLNAAHAMLQCKLLFPTCNPLYLWVTYHHCLQ